MTFTPRITVAQAIANVDALDSPSAAGFAAKHGGDQWHAKRMEGLRAFTPGQLEWFDGPAKGSADGLLSLVVSAGSGLVRVNVDRQQAAALLCQLAKALV